MYARVIEFSGADSGKREAAQLYEIGERFDQEQSAAADLLRSPLANLVLEPAPLIDDFPANDPLVESKSQHDLATPMLQGVAHELRDHHR